MKTRYTLFILLFLLPCSLIFAQSAQTIVKLDAGSIFASKPTVEIEKRFSGRLAVFIRAGIVQPSVFGKSQQEGIAQPLIGGLVLKAGPKFYLSERLALRPEIGFSRVGTSNHPQYATTEFTKGVACAFSYSIPLKGDWIIEPFAGVGAYRIWQSVKIPVEGFTNDFKTEVYDRSSVAGYGTATHLSVNGSWGIVGGLNIGLAFPSL